MTSWVSSVVMVRVVLGGGVLGGGVLGAILLDVVLSMIIDTGSVGCGVGATSREQEQE